MAITNATFYCPKCSWILLVLLSIVQTSCNKGKPESTAHSSPAPVTTLNIPVVTGGMTIDGKPEEELWQSAYAQPLTNPGITEFGEGGEGGIAIRGNYLCLSARVPEAERLVARSTGMNPGWTREDMVIWRIRSKSPVTNQNTYVILAMNPLGAYSLHPGNYYNSTNTAEEVINTGATPLEWSKDVLAAAAIEKSGWTLEVALPLAHFGLLGFISLERVRAPRPAAPELSWYWPAPFEHVDYKIGSSNVEPAPKLVATPLPLNVVKEEKLVIPVSANPESPLANVVAALRKEVWTKAEQELLGVRSMLSKNIQSRRAEYAEQEKLAWREVRTVEDWERFRDQRLSALHKWVGTLPEPTPLRATVTRAKNYGEGFVIENLVYESRPNFIVTANLYLPENRSGKIPAVVVAHAHHTAKTHSELQDLGMTWARSGTAVLVMDQINAGERSQSQPWSRESYFGRYATGNQLYLAGESLIKWMAWDMMRGIDLLTERSYIDPDRIVMLGAVAGGGDPAALTANLDPRIAAVIPFNFGEAGPEEHYTIGPREYDFETADPGDAFWETTRSMGHSVSGQFFPWFVCAAGAPRPFIFAFEMGWPTTVEDEPAWARYKKVYELYGQRDHLAEVHGLGPFPGPGECTHVSSFHRNRIDPILNRWLQIPIPETDYHNVLPASELMCLTPAAAIEHRPQPVSSVVKDLAVKRLTASRSKREGLTADERTKMLRVQLKEKLGDIEPAASPVVKDLWKKPYSGFQMEAITIETEPGITLPVFMLLPETGTSHRAVVIALAQGGKESFLLSRPNEIASLLSNGIAVCLPDLRGMGELTSEQSRGPGGMGLAANELILGNTLTGSRLKDTRTIFRWLAGRSDIDPNRIALWGDSFSEPNAPDFQFDQSPGQQAGPVAQRQAEPLGPFLAILTALYEDQVTAVGVNGGLVSFLSVLEDRFCQIPQDVIVPGILELTDLGEMVASIAPRPVYLQNLVNGVNKKVATSDVEKEYGAGTSRVLLAEKAGNRSLAVWLSEQCLKK
jgi:dienelactone hydrolase